MRERDAWLYRTPALKFAKGQAWLYAARTIEPTQDNNSELFLHLASVLEMAARTWSLNVLLLALVIAVAFGAWGGTSCVVLTNTDFPGNDIKCLDGLSNIYACADKCATTGGCLAFLWAPNDNPGNECCLKYAISQSNRNPDGRLTVITGYGDCRAIFDPYQPGP